MVVVLMLAQMIAPNCVATLRARGYGEIAAKQVAPYEDCLNATMGNVKQLRDKCGAARAKAAGYRGSTSLETKVRGAVNWLDAMTHWRAECETRLTVEP